MPDNDFTSYMQEPVSWGMPPAPWQGGSYGNPSTSFSQIGGQYLGNIGSLGGMGMDAVMRRGMWDVRSAGGYGYAARAQQQVSMIETMMRQAQTHQQGVMGANMARIAGPGYDSLTPGGQAAMQGIVGMIPGAQRVLTPGALSYQGMQQAFGAVANYNNQWTPDSRQLSGFHNAFQNYFYSGGKENFARTSGLAADDMMSVVAEASRRGAMKPGMFSEARKAQDAIFGQLSVGAELSKAGITSKDVLADLDASMGDIGGLRERLTTRLRKSGARNAKGEALTDREMTDIVGDFAAKAGMADIETLRYAGGMKGAASYGEVFKGFKNAGFGGDFGQLMDKLEQQFGDSALNPDRMRAMQQKLAAIVDMTGKSLEEISNLMSVVQYGPGAGLSGERAATLVGIGTGVGAGLLGLTKAQRMEMQGKAMNALASTEKSPRALVEDILQSSSDPQMQALSKQLQGSTGKQGADMLRGLMTTPGQFGLTGATADAFKAIAAGDMRPAAVMREMQADLVSRELTAYNQGTGDSPARKAQRARLESMGVTFQGDKAVGGGVNALDRLKRAGADVLGGLDSRAQDALRAAGAEFGANLTPEQQMALGSTVASLSNLGSQKPPTPALQEAYKKITGQDLSTEDALKMGANAIGRVGVLGTSVNAGYYQGAVDRASAMALYDPEKAKAAEVRARRTGALNTLGDVMMSKGLLGSMLGKDKLSGVLSSLNITDQTMVAGLERIGSLDEKGQQDVQTDITGLNRLNAMLEGETSPEARGKIEADIAKRKDSLKAKGLDEGFLDKLTTSDEGGRLMGMLKDAADVAGKNKEITVKVVGVLENAKGEKVGEIKDQNNKTSPENSERPSK